MNFKRRKSRRQVRCTLCTPHRWRGNAAARVKATQAVPSLNEDELDDEGLDDESDELDDDDDDDGEYFEPDDI